MPIDAAAGRAASGVVEAASDVSAVQQQMAQLDAGVRTRAAAERCSSEMAEVRQRLERELAKRKRLFSAKVDELLELLDNPVKAWGEQAFWQLAMCEFALRYDAELNHSGRQMGAAYRSAALWALRRDKGETVELPRFKGLHEMNALQAVLLGSEQLRFELHRQLAVFKRLYCSTLSTLGRFKKLSPRPGETLLQLMERTHMAARGWRPRGNPGKEPSALGVPVSKVKGAYDAEWIQESLEAYHKGAGKILSLRGTVSIAKLYEKRYLKSIPEEERPTHECRETLRLRDIQAHDIQRFKALEHSFSRYVTAVQVSVRR